MDKDFSDMMGKFADMMGNSATSSNNFSSHKFSDEENKKNFNFDVSTLIKLKSVMDKANSVPDPKENLLKSLKPYLRNDRQAKLNQYINLFSISKMMEILKQTGGENNGQ